jgi:hypothetical protein
LVHMCGSFNREQLARSKDTGINMILVLEPLF